MIIRRFMVSMMVVACFGSSSFVTASRGSFDYNDNILFDDDERPPRNFKEWIGREENRRKLWYGALIIGGVWVIYHYGPTAWGWVGRKTGFISWWKDSYVDLFGNKLPGKEWTLTTKNGRKVTVRQLHVLHQTGASCGYGALYWTERIKDAFDGGQQLTQQDMYDAQAIARAHGPDGARRMRIVKDRVEIRNPNIIRENERLRRAGKADHLDTLLDPSGDWLTGHELVNMLKYEGKPDHTYTVFDDAAHIIGVRGREESTSQCEAARMSETPYTHAFILGTMEHDYKGEKGAVTIKENNGHFMGVVYHTDGKGNSVYTIVDTMNDLREKDPRVMRLIRAIDGDY